MAQTINLGNIDTVTYNGNNVEIVNLNSTEIWAYNPFTVATGGTVTTDGDYKIHTFTGSGTFTVTAVGADDTVEYLIIGGGGAGHGGGEYSKGGGGAGGYLTGNTSISTGNHTITIGAGATGIASASQTGPNGSNSSGVSLTAYGGGGGGAVEDAYNCGNGARSGSGGSGVVIVRYLK